MENTKPQDECCQTEDLNSNGQEVSAEATEAKVADLEKELFSTKESLKARERELASAKAKIQEYETKISEVRDFVKKMEQEVQNVKDRAKRDQQKEIDRVLIQFFKSFLPSVDNLERSLQSTNEESAFVDGVRLIEKQIQDLLKSSGVQKIEAKGEVFDPSLHEALTTQVVESSEQNDRVIEVVEDGYRYNDQVLRPTQVIVGRSE